MKIFIIMSLLVLSVQASTDLSKVKVPAKPGIDNNKQYDFSKEPVKFLEATYLDYHFSKLDRGLKRVATALKVIDPLYKKDRNSLFFPKKFAHAKAFEIKATLHMLRGLLLYKKGMSVTVETSKKDKATFKKMLGKQKKQGGKLNAKDMELFAQIKAKSRDKAQKKMQNLLSKAMREMELAIKLDPKSPTVHYQYAKMMTHFMSEGDTDLVERHFYQAGKLSHLEKDPTGVKKSLQAIREVNPKSKYITKLEKL